MSGINPIMRALPLAAAAVVMAMLATPSVVRCADTASESAGESGVLEEVIVTATHREQNLFDVPESISALSGDSLQVLGDAGDDVKQLAFKVPSLNIESSNGRAFPRFYIRGYGNTDFHDFASQPVGLVYDDIVQENPALKGFPIFDQADVEVLRGPQGTLFGRNSPAGVVKLESARPQIGETSGFVSISDGTYNSAVFQGVVNLPINDVMAFRASVQGQHRDNWVDDPVRNEKFGGYNDWAARLQLLFKPGDTFSALVNVHGRYLTGSSTLFRANILGPGNSSLVPGFDPATMYADGPNDSKLTTIGANVHLTWSLPAVTLQSITGYESVQKYFALGDIDGGCGDTFGVQNGACASVLPVNFIGNHAGPGVIPFAVETSAGLPNHYQLTQEFRAVSRNEGPLTGQAGLFFFYEDVTAADDDYCSPDACVATAPLFALQDTLVSRQKNNAEAIFASLDYKPIEPFTATAGIRLTEDHRSIDSHFTPFIAGLSSPAPNAPIEPLSASKTAGNVSWDVSGDYKLSPELSVYARIATGFRAPTLGEAGFGSSVQVVRSENIISYEGGFKADLFEHRARLSLDGFYYDVKNQQISAVGGAANTTILLNAKDTIGYGSELDFEAHPVPNLTFNLSGSLNFTRIDDPGLTVAVGGGVPAADILNPYISIPGFFGPVHIAQINGNPLPQAAKYVLDTSLRYEFPLSMGGRLYLYTDWSYRSGINFFLYESKDFDAPSLTQGGVRIGYTWSDGKYDVAAFCRNCTNQIRAVGGIDFNNLTGYINDPRIVGGQFRVRF